MFLIRMAFWLMIIVLLLPTDQQQQSDVYGTAEAAVKDVSGFCDRNPGICEKGKEAFDIFVRKAQFGAHMLMGFIKEQTGTSSASETAAPALEQSAPAGVNWQLDPPASAAPPAATMSSQDTLNPEDLQPAWGNPRRAGSKALQLAKSSAGKPKAGGGSFRL
jgi:hypothetical protein